MFFKRKTIASMPAPQPDSPQYEQQMRRMRTIEALQAHRIRVPVRMPLCTSEAQTRIKPVDQILRRAQCAMLSAEYAQCVAAYRNKTISKTERDKAKSFFLSLLERWQSIDTLSENERRVFYGRPSAQQLIDLSWGIEAAAVLFWAVEIIDELPYPDTKGYFSSDHPLYRPLFVHMESNLEHWLQSVSLRATTDILDALDICYLMDWACVEASLHSKKPAGHLDGGIVNQRHRALNWLTYYDEKDDWDHVSTDT